MPSRSSSARSNKRKSYGSKQKPRNIPNYFIKTYWIARWVAKNEGCGLGTAYTLVRNKSNDDFERLWLQVVLEENWLELNQIEIDI